MDAKTLYESKPWLRFYPPGVPPTVPVPEQSLPDVFDAVTEKYGKKTAIAFYGNQISFKQLREQVDRFATGLSDLGIKQGDRVALYLVNSPQYIIAYFAALKIGATLTPISPVYTSVEVRHQLTDSGAESIVCQDFLYENVANAGVKLRNVVLTGIGEYLPALKRLLGQSLLKKGFRSFEVPAPKALAGPGFAQFQDLVKKYPPSPPHVVIDPKRDVATLPYTGGTTGSPKGAVLTHYNLLACHAQTTAFWPIFEEGKEVVLAFLPFYHIYGQVVVMLNGLMLGSTLVLFTTPDLDDILSAVETHRASAFYGVPTMYEYLKEYDKTDRVNWKRLKLITCGADTLHESTVEDWERRTGTRIMEGYGMTETSAVTHANPLGRPVTGSFGIPLPNVVAAIVDPDTNAFLPAGEVGELVVRGPNIMQGYWNRPDDTKRALIEVDGERWLKTGDLVKMDEEGYFHFYDRKRDLIKYKGYSVFARDIEEVLYEHPQIKAAGVIGIKDPKVGQNIKAIVVLQPEARGKVSEEEIVKYCEERLAHYKVPKIVEFRGELPKTDVGKISHRELREELEEI